MSKKNEERIAVNDEVIYVKFLAKVTVSMLGFNLSDLLICKIF